MNRAEAGKHEGVELAWRLWGLGGIGRYVPAITVHHPATDPARHDTFYRLNARNRVWVARRNLPRSLVPLNWWLITLSRTRNRQAGGEGGWKPMSWRTSPASPSEPTLIL